MNDPKAEAAYHGGDDPLWAVKELLYTQPWFEKFSNTVTASIGSVLGLVWLAISLGLDIPDTIEKTGFVVIGILTAAGIYKTPNGVTDSTLKKIEAQLQKPE